MMRDGIYKFSVYKFDDKEIDQIVKLVHLWAQGSIQPVDRRQFSKQVLKYAENWKLIQPADFFKEWDSETDSHRLKWFVKAGRWYPGDSYFRPEYDLPHEALWRLVCPMIERYKGFTITKDSDWRLLNIYPATDPSHSDRDRNQIIDILNKLTLWNYIIFQYGGSTWQITPTPDRAIKSEYYDEKEI